MKTAFILMIASSAMAAGAAVGMMRYLKGASLRVLDTPSGLLEPSGTNPAPLTSSSAAGAYREGPGDLFDRSASRLGREIHALSRRGNLNLTIGVITTGFAIGLLAYMVMNEDAPTGSPAWSSSQSSRPSDSDIIVPNPSRAPGPPIRPTCVPQLGLLWANGREGSYSEFCAGRGRIDGGGRVPVSCAG